MARVSWSHQHPSGSEIRSARTAAGLTQKQAAALIYTSRRVWQMWEHDITRMHPAFWELWRIKVQQQKILKKGLTVHVCGWPVRLLADTKIDTHDGTWGLIQKDIAAGLPKGTKGRSKAINQTSAHD